MGKPLFLDLAEGEEEIAMELGRFLAYLYFARGNKLSTAIGRLSAVQYFHRLAGIDLPLRHHFLRAVKAGMGRE